MSFPFNIANGFNEAIRFKVTHYNCLDLGYMGDRTVWEGQQEVELPLPGGQNWYTAQMYKMSGHGCDGRQAEFTIQISKKKPDGSFAVIGSQSFDYDSNGGIELSGAPQVVGWPEKDFASSLSQPVVNGIATWRIADAMGLDDARKLALIREHAPIALFDSSEEFFPCSMEWAFPE